MSGKPTDELARLVSGSAIGKAYVVDASHDSRAANTGTLYIALVGERHDGHDFVAEAVSRGAPAVCVSREVRSSAAQIIVENTRKAMGPLASAIHDHPSSSLDVVGVTGTNGKTTVTHYVEGILAAGGRSPGLIGTVSTRIGRLEFESARTTPEATDFQRLLAKMRDAGADSVAAEVSSHALELDRVSGTHFAVAAFTNLSQDHLDFHGDMDSYGEAKRRLFVEHEVDHAVIDIDDPFGLELSHQVATRLTTVGAGGDIEATDADYGMVGTRFTLRVHGEAREVESPVVGAFNLKNALIAVGCCLALEMTLDEVVSGLARLQGVPGRFELVSDDEEIRVIVDYSHTPDSIDAAISAARGLTDRRVIVVVGAGGDRDVEKREKMGSAAADADMVVVTTDNPRSEDPAVIAAAVAAGIPEGVDHIVEIDREKAIEHAIGAAKPGDMVLVLGKGHETGQEIGGTVLPFDDRTVARRVMGLPQSVEDDHSSRSMTL